jgi:ubiquinone/menaquinone biosynthesis C-methylase UbiE
MPCACPLEQPSTVDVLRPGGLALTDRALALCDLPRAARVLDVGCGTGAAVAHLRKLYGYRAVGIDLAATAGHCIRALAESLPVKDAACDCVLCECVLSLVPDQEACLRELHRVLRPGGCAILSDIYDRSQPDHETELLRRCGFAVAVWQDHTRSLREFAAAAALQGRLGDIGLPSGFRPQQAGYYLAIARKEKR